MGKTSEEKHTTVGGIAGIIYQFYVFLYHLLTMERGEVVSFEKLDDAAKETPHYISLYQAKHTVKCGVNGEVVPLTNRAQDFWKAIDVWMDLIKNDGKQSRSLKEQLGYINSHEFHFVSNKAPFENEFFKLCQKDVEDITIEAINSVLDTITAMGRNSGREDTAETSTKHRSVQDIIDDLKAFELRREFVLKIKFDVESFDSIEAKCHHYLNGTVRFDDEEAKKVFDDFKVEVEKDLADSVKFGKSLSYTYEFQKKRFLKVFQYHRAENLDFRIVKEKFKPEFLDLICIKQLMKVNDLTPANTDRIAEKTSHFLSFKNRYQELHDNYRILVPEEEMFNEEIMTTWGDKFASLYKDTDNDTPEPTIISKASQLLDVIRDKELKLCQQPLGRPISNGAFYYYSDECKIGWHRDWEKFFGKKEDNQNGQNN